VAEQTGTLRRIVNGRPSGIALDLRGNLSTGTEQGFLGAAFSPDGKRLYVDYTDANGDSNVDEYVMNGENADASTRRRVLFVDQPLSQPQRRLRSCSGPTASSTSGSATAAARATPKTTGRTSAFRSARSCASIRNRRATRRTAFRPTIRSSVGPACSPRTGCSACGTRGASRSIARPEISGLATSDRVRTRRSTYAPRWRRRDQLGLEPTRRQPRVQGCAARRGDGDPIVEESHTDDWCAIVGWLCVPRPRDPRAGRRVPLRRQLSSEHRRDRATRRALRSRNATWGSP